MIRYISLAQTGLANPRTKDVVDHHEAEPIDAGIRSPPTDRGVTVSEPEHERLGIPWNNLAYGSELLGETLEIVTRMFTNERATLAQVR